MSRDQERGRSHNAKIHDNSFGRVEQFKYLGKPPTNQHSIQKKLTAD